MGPEKELMTKLGVKIFIHHMIRAKERNHGEKLDP